MDSSNQKRGTLRIEGMTCAGCQNRIEKKLRALNGVTGACVSYAKGTAEVVYDEKTSLNAIVSAIESLGYKAVLPNTKKNTGANRSDLTGVLLLILALYMFLNSGAGGFLGGIFNFFPQAEAGMGYGMLFTAGLLTSLHCVAMCGGINLSQSLVGGGKPRRGKWDIRPAAQYNIGRIASYAAVGGVVGALGSVISFSVVMKGAIQITAGIFMVILGLDMLGLAGFLRAFTPRLPGFLTKRLDAKKAGKGPLFVGLLNGLMPCGPLQAMQIYALGTGGAFQGALSMLFFGLGTVPLMFALGAFGSLMSGKFAGKVMKAGAILVIIMGVAMFSNGTALSGFGVGFDGFGSSNSESAPGAVKSVIAGNSGTGIQDIRTPLTRRGYPTLTVKKGTPVRWDLYAEPGTLNGCNRAIVIPEFGIEKKLQLGDNIIEFTPTKAGKYRYSCWMGMIRGTIIVEDASAEKAASPGAAEASEISGDAEDGAAVGEDDML